MPAKAREQFRGAPVLVLLVAAALLVAPAPAGATLRPEDPVVLTGAAVPALIGAAPSSVVAYARSAGAWQQIPVQADERATVNLKSVYNDPGTSPGVTALVYTDPGTFTGPDPDPAFDADDELTFMARDGGDLASSVADPPGTIPGTGVGLKITDPLLAGSAAYIYLFRGDGTRSPGAGRSYVSYNFGLTSGDYKATYRRGVGASPPGPNPEDTTVSSPFYSEHFSDRWIQDGISVTAGGASGVDILDRHKNLFAPGSCGRSEDTFSAGEGAFIANKSGPVRAIRSYIGANSGPYTERTEIFYDHRVDIHTDLRVHAIPSIMDFFDYSPLAAGMTYRNSLNPIGVTIDGVPESVAAGAPQWEQVSGPQGGLSMISTLDTDAPVTLGSYYLDDSTPSGGAETQCTGDTAAYGSSGSYITGGIPSTDPSIGGTSRFTSDRHIYFEAPGAGAPLAVARAAQISAPLQAALAAPPTPRRASSITLKRHGRKPILLTGSICPGASRAPLAKLQRRAKNGRFHALRRLGLKRGESCWQIRTHLAGRHAAYRVTVAGDDSRLASTSRVVLIRPRRR